MTSSDLDIRMKFISQSMNMFVTKYLDSSDKLAGICIFIDFIELLAIRRCHVSFYYHLKQNKFYLDLAYWQITDI